MTQCFDAVVIGVGAMGSSACLHLARRGVSVLGLDQFSIPNAWGSSHGESRMIRLCYYEHPDYVPLLRRAYELWDDLEQSTNQKLLYKTGGIYIGSPAGEFIAGTLRAAAEHGLPHECLHHHDLRKRFPQFDVPESCIGVFEPNAGFLLPERIISAQAELAIHHGAELHGHEAVLEWTQRGETFRVRSAKAAYECRRLIICGGAWCGRLVHGLGVQLVVTRQVLGWVQPRRPELFALGRFPVWAIDNPDGTQHYGFPTMPFGARPGLKVAHHFRGQPTDADSIDRHPRAEDEQDFRPAVQRHLPEADGPLLSMQVCMYTNSPDSHFIIDRHPAQAQGDVIVACGFSGHGFKFASVVGEVLADLAIDGRTQHPIKFLALDRFEAARAR